MKKTYHFAFLALLPIMTQCGKDSSGSGESSNIPFLGSWILKTLTIDNSLVDFTGEYRIELKADKTYVVSEDYRSFPRADYGPCWSTTRGTYEVAGDKITTNDLEETAWLGCETPDEDKKATLSYKLENSILTLTEENGAVLKYEKDASSTTLDYASQKAIVDSKSKLVINTSADAYIEDANENDNWTLLETECDLSSSSGREISQYYRSQLLGSNRIVKTDYALPALNSWNNNQFTSNDTSNGCNAPGLRNLKVSELQQARASNDFDMLYACGASCVYTLISETHDSNEDYLTIEVSWECRNVGHNTLSSPGIFGLYLDKHVGKVKCQ